MVVDYKGYSLVLLTYDELFDISALLVNFCIWSYELFAAPGVFK